MMREIRLYGHLGEKFGKFHRFDVSTPAEAMRALRVNFPEFASYLQEHNSPGYRVLIGDSPAQELIELDLHSGAPSFSIVPVVAGAGRGKSVGMIILGAALVALSGAGGFLANSLVMNTTMGVVMADAIGVMAASVGWGLIIGGVSSFLFQPPKAQGPSEAANNRPSYVFNGPVNTVQQGHPVPVGYGKLMIGSQVISAALIAEEML